MFIKVHKRFIISGHNSDNRYKKPLASYLEQGSTKRTSPYCRPPDFPIAISWAYLGHILGMSWACPGHILGIAWVYLRQTLENNWSYLGNILGISWVYLGHILGIFWAYLEHI